MMMMIIIVITETLQKPESEGPIDEGERQDPTPDSDSQENQEVDPRRDPVVYSGRDQQVTGDGLPLDTSRSVGFAHKICVVEDLDDDGREGIRQVADLADPPEIHGY